MDWEGRCNCSVHSARTGLFLNDPHPWQAQEALAPYMLKEYVNSWLCLQAGDALFDTVLGNYWSLPTGNLNWTARSLEFTSLNSVVWLL